MIAVVSADACRSAQVGHELERADSSGVPILPIFFEVTPLTGQFSYFLGNKQRLELLDRSPNDYEPDVVKAVRNLQLQSNPVPPGDNGARRDLLLGHRDRSGVGVIADEFRDVIKTLVGAVMRREKALVDFDLTDARTLFFAFRILLYLSILLALLHIPAWRAQGIHFTHPAFLPLAVAEVMIEQVSFCLLLYTTIRFFGGAAEPQAFFGSFCLLFAYEFMSEVCLLRVQIPAIQFIKNEGQIGDAFSIGGMALILVALAASIVLRLMLIGSLFRAFHLADQLDATRAAMAVAGGFGMWILSVLMISQPMLENLYHAFGRG